MTNEPTLFRVRLEYGVNEPLCYTSVLDMGRHVERMIRRADLPLAYSHGFHPHPQFQFAAPLPVGYRATSELLDLYLTRDLDAASVLERLRRQSPKGLEIVQAAAVSLDAPVLQSVLRRAEYRVELWSPATEAEVADALDGFLSRDAIPRERERKGRTQHYDLRALFSEVRHLSASSDAAAGGAARHVLCVSARCGSEGSGRPEEMLQELGIQCFHSRITRTRLICASGDEEDTEL